ncbi:MAG: sigma-54-dependent Fis family transcriptional regulator, partial [Planctomycetes bacterium]|nr:sigma-54-dependent Fis family transcriptional regulator [Planctomycetota bacterium]
EDLYFRLNVVRIDVPPLRDRASDIPLLVNAFVKELSEVHGKKVTAVSVEARRILQGHRWPGNVRELKNCIENMVVVARGEVLGEEDLPESVGKKAEARPGGASLAGLALADVEKLAIRQTLDLVEGNREKAARILKIGERTLYRKIKGFGIGEKEPAAGDPASPPGP